MQFTVREAETGNEVRLHDLKPGQAGFARFSSRLYIMDSFGRLSMIGLDGVTRLKSPVDEYINYKLELVESVEIIVNVRGS